MRTPTILLSLLLVVGGCATIFSGTDDDLTFTSNPEGASVVIDGLKVGETPLTVEVDRPGLEDKDVTVQLEGYESRTFELDKEFNSTSILNLLMWPGFIVDALTGALYKYDKTSYHVEMDDGTVTLHLRELPRGSQGQYLLPESEAPILVEDTETGLTLLFR